MPLTDLEKDHRFLWPSGQSSRYLGSVVVVLATLSRIGMDALEKQENRNCICVR